MYLTLKQPKRHYQITLEDIYDSDFDVDNTISYVNEESATITRDVSSVPYKHMLNIGAIREGIELFNQKHSHLLSDDMSAHYRTFYVPKKNGKMRRIDAPSDELQYALRELKKIFEDYCGVLYHTNSYAYTAKRSANTAVDKHVRNKSRWFLKIDAKDFFPNTTEDFVLKQFRKIYPFGVLMNSPSGEAAISKALKLCFLNGGLPQGTAISPMITNIVMLPIDYKISKSLRDNRFIYTRYADDMVISHKYDFSSVFDYSNIDRGGLSGERYVELSVENILKEEEAPFMLNKEKTRYGSSSGHNFIFGVVINKDGNKTIGHKKKKLFKATLHNFICSIKKKEPWSLGEVQSLNGNISYYRLIERETIDGIIEDYNKKFCVNIMEEIKNIIRGEVE